MNNGSEAVAGVEVPVLIAGGGPVGLTASLLLSQYGVRSLLVERHPGTAVLPKARAINARTMEMYRQMGLADEIRAAGMPPEFGKMVVWAESLAGREIERRSPSAKTAPNLAVSPATGCGCSQDVLEPVLRHRAEAEAAGDLRFHTELTDWQADGAGVTGSLLDRTSGQATPFRARYLIAADGAQSRVRRQLGVRMVGETDIYDSVNVHLRADLRPWIAERPAALYLIEQPDLRATFLTINGADRWGFLVTSLSHYGFDPDDFTPEFAAQIVRKAVGVPDLPIEVLGVRAWKASAIVADRYRDGPVFLAGDAAHEMPPTGGFGLNTGVQDAQNLAWKLAAVLNGQASDALLDSYDAERRPQAEAITRSSLLNALSMGRKAKQATAVLPRQEFLNEQGLMYGARYESAAVVADGSAPPMPDDPVTQYLPSAFPGCRAPHVWLMQKGRKISTIDLFGRAFVLIAGAVGPAWRAAAGHQKAAPIYCYVIGDELIDEDGGWHEAYGVLRDGAVLVRPDGYVAWRARSLPEHPQAALAAAMQDILCRAASTGAVDGARIEEAL